MGVIYTLYSIQLKKKMSSFFKKLINKNKHSDEHSSSEGVSQNSSPFPTTKEDHLPIQEDQLNESSPEHAPISVAGSLFSGMTLTKAARQQEDNSSPYLDRKTDEAAVITEFSFLNATSPPLTNDSSTITCESEHLETSESIDTSLSSFSFLNTHNLTTADNKQQPDEGFALISRTPPLMHSEVIESTAVSPHLSLTPPHIPLCTEPANTESSQKSSFHYTPQNKVSRQLASSSGKKKRLKAIRPGQDLIENSAITTSQPVEDSSLSREETLLLVQVVFSPEDEKLLSTDEKLPLSSCSEFVKPNDIKQEPKEIPVIESSHSVNISPSVNDVNVPEVMQSPIPLVSKLDDKSEVITDSTCTLDQLTTTSKTDMEEQIIVSNELAEIDINPTITTLTNYNVQLSAYEKLTTFLQSSDNNINQIKSEVNDLEDQFGSVIEDIFQALKLRINKRKHISELTVKEAAALAQENYELAEELSQELSSVQTNDEFPLADKTHSTILNWIDKCLSLMACEINLQEQVNEDLIKLKDEQIKELSDWEKDFSLQHAKKKLHLQTMKDDIEKERGHIALDREHIDKREQHLQDEISQRAAEYIFHKKELEEEKETVETEISKLEQLLSELQERKSKLSLMIFEENEKINSVHKELSSVQEQLDEENSIIEQNESELQKQLAKLEEYQVSYDKDMQEHNEIIDKFTSTIDSCQTRIDDIKKRKGELAMAQYEGKNWTLENISHMLQPSAKLKSLLEDEVAKDKQMKELTSKVLSLQSQLSTHHKHISDIGERLPKLQESKKAAVAARQYREAAKLANEEKELLSKMDKEKEHVNNLEKEVGDENNVLSQLNEELITLREKRSITEKEEDIICIIELRKSLTLQRSRLEKLTGVLDVPIQAILEKWCIFHELLIHDYCTKHSLNVEDYLSHRVLIPDQDTVVITDTKNMNVEILSASLEFEESTLSSSAKVQTIQKEENETENHTVKELKLKIADLEMRIAKACEDECFDLAAELDEELLTLKGQTS